jgi:methionine-gamma-lyase
MTAPHPSKTHIGNHKLHPETLMLNYGYDPELSEGAVKPPVFLTSTFVFKSAEEGRDFFDFVSGRREPPAGKGAGLVYSRFNHPNSEIVEDGSPSMSARKAARCFHPACRRSQRRCWPSSGQAMPFCIRSRSMAERKRCWQRLSSTGRRRRRLCRWRQRSVGAGGGRRSDGQGPGLVILIETPANPTNGPGRCRDDPRVADAIGQNRATRRSLPATIPCSDRSSSGRSSTAPISRFIR